MTGDEAIAARFLQEVYEPADRPGPERLCRACVRVLPVTRAAIMIWVREQDWELLGASDPVAADDVQRQVAAGEGPGLQAFAGDAPVLVPDYGAALGAGQWPLLAATGRPAAAAVFAFPLYLGLIRVGTLDLYSQVTQCLDRDGFAAAVQVAELVTVILLSTLNTRSPQERAESVDIDAALLNGPGDNGLGDWWEPAPSTREIHQATGMVAVQLHTDIATAHARLVAHAVATDRSLARVAGDVLARRLRLQPNRHQPPGPHWNRD